jgi:hypothetical protein
MVYADGRTSPPSSSEDDDGLQPATMRALLLRSGIAHLSQAQILNYFPSGTHLQFFTVRLLNLLAHYLLEPSWHHLSISKEKKNTFLKKGILLKPLPCKCTCMNTNLLSVAKLVMIMWLNISWLKLSIVQRQYVVPHARTCMPSAHRPVSLYPIIYIHAPLTGEDFAINNTVYTLQLITKP